MFNVYCKIIYNLVVSIERQKEIEVKRVLYATQYLTLILLTWTIWRAPTNASKWRMGFNSAFKGLKNVRFITNIHSVFL